MNRRNARVMADIRAYALGLPGAEEKTPWGESVVRVKKGIFVYFGRSDAEKAGASEAKQAHIGHPGDYSLNLKLPYSGPRLIRQGRGRPSDYGLGAKGWVVVTVRPGETVSFEEMRDLVVESYRAIAPPTLVAQLELPARARVKRTAPADAREVGKRTAEKRTSRPSRR